MSFRPLGKWVAVKTTIGGEKITDAGIIVKDDKTGKGGYVWSEVLAVGHEVVEDIQKGDKVYWEIATNRGNHYGAVDLVNEEYIIMVERDETE